MACLAMHLLLVLEGEQRELLLEDGIDLPSETARAQACADMIPSQVVLYSRRVLLH